MGKLDSGTWKQKIFYPFIFLCTTIIPEPNPVYENFWSKGSFYDSVPFTVYYLEYKILYAAFLTTITWGFVRFAKKHL